MSHTPTPWRAYRKHADSERFCIIDEQGREIAWIKATSITRTRKWKDAQFIAHACNSHDDLVAACEIGLSFIEAVCFNTDNPKKRKNYADAASTIRAALAKAKGEA